MPASETETPETQVAEDVERLRSVAKFHTGTDLAPEDEAALTRVLDALETAQAKNTRLQFELDTGQARNQSLRAEAREKDETIARLREALEKIASRAQTVGVDRGYLLMEVATEARAALSPEQGDEG